MNKLVAVLGSAALLSALLASGYALAQSALAIAPVAATLQVQQDGTCRGHVLYAIAPTDNDLADSVEIGTGVIESKSACARLTTLASTETFDTKGGKLSIAVTGATVMVLANDPDGDGPRAAGECDIHIAAHISVVEPEAGQVLRGKDIVRTRPNPTCGALTNLISNSCWVARGSWPPGAPLPPIPKCP